MKAKPVTEIALVLSEDEARRLLGLIQNPLYSENYEEETFRLALFNTIKDALERFSDEPHL